MQRNKCGACGGTDVYLGKLSAQGGVILRRPKRNVGWNWVFLNCITCLTCGTVQPYIRDADFETVRKWKAEDSSDPSYGQEDNRRSGPDPRIIVAAIIAVMLALFGAAVAMTLASHHH